MAIRSKVDHAVRDHADPRADASLPVGGESLTRLVEELLQPGAIEMAAQPIVSLADGSVLGFEMLARTSIPCSSGPDQWLEHASYLGVRTELELACLQAVGDRGAPPGDVRLFVNLSASTFLDPRVDAVLSPTPAPGDRDHRARAGPRLPGAAPPPPDVVRRLDHAGHRRRGGGLFEHVARPAAAPPIHQDRPQPGAQGPSRPEQARRPARPRRIRPPGRHHLVGRRGRDERGAQCAAGHRHRSRSGLPAGAPRRRLAAAPSLADRRRPQHRCAGPFGDLGGVPRRTGREDPRPDRRRRRDHGLPQRALRVPARVSTSSGPGCCASSRAGASGRCSTASKPAWASPVRPLRRASPSSCRTCRRTPLPRSGPRRRGRARRTVDRAAADRRDPQRGCPCGDQRRAGRRGPGRGHRAGGRLRPDGVELVPGLAPGGLRLARPPHRRVGVDWRNWPPPPSRRASPWPGSSRRSSGRGPRGSWCNRARPGPAPTTSPASRRPSSSNWRGWCRTSHRATARDR